MAAQLEIYTTGGGHFLVDAFNFIAAFTGSPGYDALLTVAVTTSVIYFALKLMWGEGLKDISKWFLLVIAIGGLFIGSKASVVIFDRTKSDFPIGIVDNVPYGMRVSDLLCMSNLVHASATKEHDNDDNFQGLIRPTS